MLIVGAKGFAKEVLEICNQLGLTNDLVLYDDISNDLPQLLCDQFTIIRTEATAKNYFLNGDRRFVLGLGNPLLRKKMFDKFSNIGGDITSIVSPKANIGHYTITIGPGATVLDNAHITTSVQIGKCVVMYPNSIITHDCKLGDFVELSPGATILGECSIGDLTHIGANATILPKISIGRNVIVGAGSVVTKDVPDNSLVMGVPALFKKNLPPTDTKYE